MPKMMRILVALFVTLPLFLSVDVEPQKEEKKDYLDSALEIEHRVEDFKKKTEEEKDKILEDLESTISDLREKIKVDISEKKEPNEKIIELLKKGVEFTRCMEYKVCNKEDKNCESNKMKLMNPLLDAIQDNFGQCPVTMQHIKTLTENTFFTFQFINVLINTIVKNADYVDPNKKKIISELINCLLTNIDEYFPIMIAKINTKKMTEEDINEIKGIFTKHLFEQFLKLNKIPYEYSKDKEKNNKILRNPTTDVRTEKVYKEILDILKEIKEIKGSNNDNTMVIIVSCLATITVLIGGFFLYRFIRRRKNSELIENTKDFVSSENKLN